jgi:triacylglycerol esterase/lipase EstA (alpha/beta hydrolase family)
MRATIGGAWAESDSRETPADRLARHEGMARSRGLMRPVLLALATLALVPAAAAADDGGAPVDRPGPALSVPADKLAASLECNGALEHATRDPVLLVPGTGATAKDNYSWNYEPALDAQHIPWCAVTFPSSGNNDIQVNGEYTVNAIRVLHARSGRRIAIIGHSQGGMVPRWAMRFWPDTRPMVEDLVGIAASNHGSSVAQNMCSLRGSCTPADWQQSTNSNFLRALNAPYETFGGTDYTVISSHTDEEVQPDGAAELHTGAGAITNVHVQDICPADTTEHLGLGTYDAVAYALAMDAIDHAGPAVPDRVSRGVCSTPFMPGVNPLTFPTDAAQAAYDVETSDAQSLTAEPPLACYTTAAGCPGQRGRAGSGTTRARAVPPGRCRLVFHVHPRRGARVTRAVVRLPGGRTKIVRGRRLRAISVLGPLHGPLRITTTASDGWRRTSVRRMRGCRSDPPRTRGSRAPARAGADAAATGTVPG